MLASETTTTATTLRSHFGSSRGHSWPGLSQWLPPSAQTVSPFSRWAPPCRRRFACPCLRRRCCFFGHSPEHVAAESEVGRDHLLPCRDDAAPAGLGSMERVVEQIDRSAFKIVLGSLSWICQCPRSRRRMCQCPQIIEKLGDFVQLVPSERMQEPILEQISLVPQITEKIVEVMQPVPLERIQEPISWCLRSRRKSSKLFNPCLRNASRIESWSRLWIRQCSTSRRKTWMVCSSCHRSACRIARRTLGKCSL